MGEMVIGAGTEACATRCGAGIQAREREAPASVPAALVPEHS
jgi:hypothetical protein